MVRVAAVSMRITATNDEGEWKAAIQAWVEAAHRRHVELLVFPEYSSIALENRPDYASWVRGPMTTFFQGLVDEFGLTVLSGSHALSANTAMLFRPGLPPVEQVKVHLIPSEYGMETGRTIRVFDLNGVKTAILVGYDIEFPEWTRALVQAGVELVLCPTWSSTRSGFLRVRHCAMARAVENQIFVIQAALIGTSHTEGEAEPACGASAILAPCDPPHRARRTPGRRRLEPVDTDLGRPRL